MPAHLGKPAFHYTSVDSTMRVAADRAREGCPHGTIVTADHQSAGRGRLGRSWISPPGQGLYLSVVLRPRCQPDAAPILTLVAGLGVREALEELTGLGCDIRWPNDILIRERKCCGILVEMEANRGAVESVVVGIGINLNHRRFPPGLRSEATSLLLETGRSWGRHDVLGPVLASLAGCLELHRDRGDPAIVTAFQQESSYACGRRVIVEDGPEGAGTPASGVTAGLTGKGLLLIRSDDGNVAPLLAGSVRPAPVTM